MTSDVKLMDVTIREGSYVIDFKWTAGQVSEIAQAIDQAGIPYMEVGNGGGLGYFDSIDFKPQSTDIEQIRAAKKVVKKCKVGVLAGPESITKKRHIDAVQKEIDFIRIAARIDQVEQAKGNAEYASSLNIPVFFQLMRSSKRPLKDIIQAAKKAKGFGASSVYVVDTNGFYLPSDVTQIILSLKESLNIPIGFHPHNNLMLAVANSLAAVQAGADFIDASLFGIGRDAGNAQLEALVACLQRRGKLKKIQLEKLLEAAERFIEPILTKMQGSPPIQIATAHHNVCLYPIEYYLRIAREAKIDFYELMKKLGTLPESEPDIEKVLKEFGKDPKEIFKKLGLS